MFCFQHDITRPIQGRLFLKISAQIQIIFSWSVFSFTREEPQEVTQPELLSYRTLEERIPKEHPLRRLVGVVDVLLKTMDADFAALYARAGRESIPAERLFRASLLQVLFSIRSVRQLVQHLDYNLLHRWFVGLTQDDPVWDHSTFSANRNRLLNERIIRLFFERVVLFAEGQQLWSDEHFSVEGTFIEAWAPMKRFVKRGAWGV